MHRTTIYLPDDQYEGLLLLARRMRTTISDLLRFAADDCFAEEADRLRQVPDPFKLELTERGLRQQELIFGLRFLRDRRMRCNRP